MYHFQLFVAVALVLTVASADQSFSGYPPSGWKPSGRAFSLPVRARNLNATPETAYGPPQQEYGPPPVETTTTEIPTTTTEMMTEQTTMPDLSENLVSPAARSEKLKAKEDLAEAQPAPTYIVLPQSEKFIYLSPVNYANAAILAPAARVEQAVEQPKLTVPIQAYPAIARIQAQPQIAPLETPAVVAKYQKAQFVQFEQLQQVPTYSSAYIQSQSWTPYSASFYQIYQ